MIHGAAPHFLWPFAVQYAAHQLNPWLRISLPETSPTLRWTGKVGDASVFRVWGSRAFVHDTSAEKLSTCTIVCVFLGFVPDAHGWQFYHPTSRRVFPSQDVTFDESVPFYRLFPYCSAPPPPLPLFLAPGPPPVDPLSPLGPAPSGVFHEDPLLGTAPGQVAVGSGAAPGAASGGAACGGAGPGGKEPGGAKPAGVETGGVEPGGAEYGGADPRGASSPGGQAYASLWLSPQHLCEWFVKRAHLRSGAPGAGGAGDAGAGGTGVTAGAGGPSSIAATGPRGARTRGTGAAGTGGVADAGAGDPKEPRAAGDGGTGTGGAGAGGVGAARAGAVDPGARGAGSTPAYPLPSPSPYTQQSGGITERRELASCPVSPVHTARRVPRSRPPPIPGTHAMALRPSSVPLRVPLPLPPKFSLPAVPDPEYDCARAARPTVAHLLPTAVADPSFESVAASALVAEPFLLPIDRKEDFECLAAAVPRFSSMLLALEGDLDAPDIPTPCSYAEAITGPYSSQWQAAMDAEMALVKRPSGSPPAFKAGYVARGFIQRQGVCYFQTFSPTSKMTTLRVLLHVATQRDYELHFLEFSTQWSLRRPVYGLCQAPREWHNTLRTTLAALGFAPTTTDLLLFLRTDTSLLPFYILLYKSHTCTELGPSAFGFQFTSPQPTPLSTGHSLSAPPLDESVEPSGMCPELVGCLIMFGMGLVLGGRGPVVLTGHADASWVDDSAIQRSSQGYTFSLDADSVSWRSTRSSSILSSSCEAEIYARAMAAQELCWLTYLLTDLGEQPRLPPVL
ncbi:unnamed protein product [Closterium sp. NIES-53]